MTSVNFFHRSTGEEIAAALTIEEPAAARHVSHATIDRESKIARSWLRRKLNGRRHTPAAAKQP